MPKLVMSHISDEAFRQMGLYIMPITYNDLAKIGRIVRTVMVRHILFVGDGIAITGILFSDPNDPSMIYGVGDKVSVARATCIIPESVDVKSTPIWGKLKTYINVTYGKAFVPR